MKKRISHFFLAAIMAAVTLLPMFAQTASAQTFEDPSPRKTVLANQFNRRANLFTRVLIETSGTVGVDRTLFILAGALGIPVTIIQSEFANFSLSIDRFVMVQLLSRASGINTAFIVNLVNMNRNFGQIALQLNVPLRLVLFRMNGLLDIFSTEFRISTGALVLDRAKLEASLAVQFGLLNSRLALFQNMLGLPAFNALLLRRLAFETGQSFDTMVSLRDLLANLPADQFVTFVLADNTLSAAINVGLERNGVVLVTPGGIYGRFESSSIPIQLLLNRLQIFQRSMNDDDEG
jgi:hypothetical protein